MWKLLNGLNELKSPNMFLTCSARVVICQRINACVEFLQSSNLFIKFGRTSHNLGTREEKLSEPW